MKVEELLATQQIDSTEYYDFEKEEWLEQEEWRVYLGGLFLPGYPEELALLIPQIRYHIISTQYLGLDGWDSSELINDINRYIQGTVFATDYHPGPQNKSWNDFYTKFYKKYNHESDRVSALAYDAANLVKMALENGADSAEDVNIFLGSVETYNGASCIINFKSTNRANDAVGIFAIKDNTVIRLK
jgi:branched-chain amino acid transport system substrate-binding protein